MIWTCAQNGRRNAIRKVMKWRSLASRPRGRPKTRWKEQVINYLQTLGIKEQGKEIKNREELRKILQEIRKKFTTEVFNSFLYNETNTRIIIVFVFIPKQDYNLFRES